MSDFQGVLDAVAKRYQRLAPHLKNAVVSQGNAAEANGRHLEFYPPWESDNPTPGKSHVQLFDKNLSPPDLHAAVSADMLHLLGSTDPRTGAQVDPAWMELKNQLPQIMTPQQHLTNLNAYKQDQAADGDVGTYDDWMKRSRIDAYVRAGLFPDQNPEWKGFTTPEQGKLFDQMSAHLQTPPDEISKPLIEPAPIAGQGIGLSEFAH